MLKADHTAKDGKRENQMINGGSGHLTIMFRCASGEMQQRLQLGIMTKWQKMYMCSNIYMSGT